TREDAAPMDAHEQSRISRPESSTVAVICTNVPAFSATHLSPKGTILELFFRNLCQLGHNPGSQSMPFQCGFDLPSGQYGPAHQESLIRHRSGARSRVGSRTGQSWERRTLSGDLGADSKGLFLPVC